MLTLPEAQKLTQDELVAGIIYQMYWQMPLLYSLPFEDVAGSAYVYNREDVAMSSGSTTRALNGDYTEGTAGVTSVTVKLGRYGGKAQIDSFIQVSQSNITNQLETQVIAKTRALAARFQADFFNGDTTVDINGMDGLGKLLKATSQESVTLDALDLSELDQALLLCDGQPSAIFANAKTIAHLNKLVRDSRQVLNTIEMAGAILPAYNGVPVVKAGRKAGFTEILTDGEFFVCRFGADGVHGIQANTPSAQVFMPDSVSPSNTVRIDWYSAIALKVLTSAYHFKRALV